MAWDHDYEPWEDAQPGIAMMAEQLTEARAFLVDGSSTRARLAFILLDNAAEVLMFRHISSLLKSNPFYERLLQQWQEILREHPHPEAQNRHDEILSKYVPAKRRKAISRVFAEKVAFLQEHDAIGDAEGRVLNSLHNYRNELYHNDRVRPETIVSASLLYFEIVCTLFERCKSPGFIELLPPGKAEPTPAELANDLRKSLGIDIESLGKVLSTHLYQRLDQLDKGVLEATKLVLGYEQFAPVLVSLAQVPPEQLPDDLSVLTSMNFSYRYDDIARWRSEVEELTALRNKLELFARFAEIEAEMEPLERQIERVGYEIDRQIQFEIDLRRGK